MTDTIFDFVGGNEGPWKIIKMATIKGEPLQAVSHIKRIPSSTLKTNTGIWTLKGIISNLRYTEKEEKEKLIAIQADLGRPTAMNTALIPMRKS